MTDVIKIARGHRERLEAEIDKIDEFIAMAEELSRRGDSDGQSSVKNMTSATGKDDEPTIELARRSSNGAAAN